MTRRTQTLSLLVLDNKPAAPSRRFQAMPILAKSLGRIRLAHFSFSPTTSQTPSASFVASINRFVTASKPTSKGSSTTSVTALADEMTPASAHASNVDASVIADTCFSTICRTCFGVDGGVASGIMYDDSFGMFQYLYRNTSRF